MNDAANDPHTRTLDLEGSRNFRDLGGIATATGTTRCGVVYRSDRLSNLTDGDRVLLCDLGIATIIDMRTAEERHRAPNRLPRQARLKQVSRSFLPRHTLPMFDAINSGEYNADAAYAAMIEQYETLALEHADDYGRIVEDLIQPGAAPAIVHCTSGKDRTGMVTAIILLAIDTPIETIIADYTMTQGRIEKVDYFADTANPRAVEIVMAAKPDYIHAALKAITSEFGSVTSYLRKAVGIDAEKQRRLRALLIDA
jgi:protein-tyrosine phosphatase